MKTCTKCYLEKELGDFYKSKSGKFGVAAACKLCTKEYLREYHAKWYQENKEKKLAHNKEWHQNNRAKMYEIQMKYAKSHPEYWRNKNAKRRMRIGAKKFLVTNEDIRKIMAHPCAYCGGASEHLDHIVPLSRGGLHKIGNLAPACKACNLKKSNKFVVELRSA